MQETVEPEKMGRAFSVLPLISSVTMPVGLLFSSPIAEKVGVHLVSDFGTQHDGAYHCCHHSLCHQIPEKKSGIECRDKEPHDRIDAVFF